MGIGYSDKDGEPKLYDMNGHVLKNTDCEKDLGVFFDKSFKFDKHINTVINKANMILGIVKKTFECFDKVISPTQLHFQYCQKNHSK